MFKNLVLKNRSYRRYDAHKQIPYETLVEFIDIARNTPSAANKQPMRYYAVCDEATNKQVFETLKWAGYLKDWQGPEEIEQPTGYIVIFRDKKIAPRVGYDDGIVAQTIALAAVEQGYGCCMIHNCSYNALFELFNLDKKDYAFSIVLALGVPVETIVLEEDQNNQIEYYRDADMTHHVPKRKLEDVLLSQKK